MVLLAPVVTTCRRPLFHIGSSDANLFNEILGIGFRDDDRLLDRWMRHSLCPRLRNSTSESDDQGKCQMSDTGDNFQVTVKAPEFSPDELSVTVSTEDGTITIRGKHEESTDEHGFVSRSFTRRVQIPQGVSADEITSHLDAQGMLTIEAPKKKIEAQTKDLSLRVLRHSDNCLRSKTASKNNKINDANDVRKISLDVSEFSPDELSITASEEDGTLTVRGKHEEHSDENGFASMSFVRRFVLPQGVSTENIVPELDAQGQLKIALPLQKPAVSECPKERIVPVSIIHTLPQESRSSTSNDEHKSS